MSDTEYTELVTVASSEPITPTVEEDPATDAQHSKHPAQQQPVATPCRAHPQTEMPSATPSDAVSSGVRNVSRDSASSNVSTSNASEVPDISDNQTPHPVPGKPRLSEEAIRARMRRVMEPSKRTGKRKVSDAVF